MNKKLTPNQKDVIDTIVIVMLAIIAALVALCLTFATGKAMQAETVHNGFTGGSECHAYSTSTTVIQPVYDYCQNAKGNGAPKAKKPVQRRTVSNSGSVMPTVDNTPETPVVEPPVIVNPPTDNPTPEPKEDKVKCNNGFGNGPDTACKTHGNAQNQDNTGTHLDGHDMSGHTEEVSQP